MFFIIEDTKETILDFSKGTVIVLSITLFDMFHNFILL